MTYESFIAAFPKQTKTRVGVLVKCPAHPDSTASLQVCKSGDGKILLKCFANCATESVVAALGLTMKDLFPDTETKEFKVPASNSQPTAPTEKPVIEKIYSYQNHTGQEVYQVVRLKPKSFRQRHMVESKWVWTMEDVTRVLYHLPEILKAQKVWVCEGEKDVDNLTALGFVATSNVGGAGKWLDGYTETLAGKDVIICGDNDKPGEEHVQTVFDSICGTAKTVKIVKLPTGIKDASDFITTFSNPQDAKAALESMADSAHPFVRGVRLPIYTMSELEPGYQRMVNSMSENSFNLGRWLPTLGVNVRPLICGELMFILGDTGAGKTGLLSEIARAALPLPTLFFEMELPPELLFERTVSAQTNIPCRDVETAYKSGDSLGAALDTKFKNLFICTESKITLADLENYIIKSELKIGTRPKLVLIDYIQLMQAQGVNRREKVSDIAEGLKVLAKTTRTIIVCASQIHRPDGDEEIHLHSAKESGCLSQNTTNLLTPYGFQCNMFCKMITHTLKTSGEVVGIESAGIDSGEKNCIRLRLRSGRFLDCTPNHKVLTDVGWVAAGKITREHAIAAVRKIQQPDSCRRIKEARFMGWMIGDGCSLYRLASFTCADPKLSTEFVKETRELFGIKIKRRKLAAHLKHDEFYLSKGIKTNASNPISIFLREGGMWGLKSYEKRIPEWFLKQADNESIAAIVGGLVDTDGSVRLFKNGRKNVKFNSTSEGLAWDFIFCLTRLGIFGRMQLPSQKKKPNYNSVTKKMVTSRRPIYEVLIDDSRDVEMFSRLVFLASKKSQRLDGFQRASHASNYGDNVGFWAWKRIAEQAKREGRVDRQFMMARCQERRISQEKLAEVLKRFKNPPPELCRLLNPNIYWDRLCDAKMIGRRKVFDRTVNQETPNFVANGIVVHNSIENSCGLLLGAWRDSNDKNLMFVKVLKSTKGGSGTLVECNFDGAKMRITERAKVCTEDVPKPYASD